VSAAAVAQIVALFDMPKAPAIIFSCSNCGAQFQKWLGRCLECGQWGTVVKSEKLQVERKTSAANNYPAAEVSALSEIKSENFARLKTNLDEFDRVLGGGLVPGSLTLLGGEPGVGKSTLALQLAAIFPNSFYFSGEESPEQIKMRAERLKLSAPTLRLANETNIEKIISSVRKNRPTLAVVDSIQTVSSDQAEGEAGGLTQTRACAAQLMELAKSERLSVIIVGQVTKEGGVAGPKSLEHVVDTVLYLEGDRFHQFRILRAAKNRFGSTDEVGIFAMAENGLRPVSNPSAAFLAERTGNPPGNVVACLMEGARPLLVEIQALVGKTAFGYPARKASGFDLNRLHVLIAVLEKRAGLKLGQYDVHLNVAGGLRAAEPAADLAVALAVASAYKDKPLGADLAAFGEIGLSGEIRPVGQTEKRLRECEQLGLKRVVARLPAGGAENKTKIKILNVKDIQEIIKQT